MKEVLTYFPCFRQKICAIIDGSLCYQSGQQCKHQTTVIIDWNISTKKYWHVKSGQFISLYKVYISINDIHNMVYMHGDVGVFETRSWVTVHLHIVIDIVAIIIEHTGYLAIKQIIHIYGKLRICSNKANTLLLFVVIFKRIKNIMNLKSLTCITAKR